MYLTFDLPRGGEVKSIKKKVADINKFLKNHIDEQSEYRHFEVFLLPPIGKCPMKNSLFFEKRSSKHYCLLFQCINENGESKDELELLYNLSEDFIPTSDIQENLTLLSCLTFFPMKELSLTLSEKSITVIISLDENQRNKVKSHLHAINKKFLTKKELDDLNKSLEGTIYHIPD